MYSSRNEAVEQVNALLKTSNNYKYGELFESIQVWFTDVSITEITKRKNSRNSRIKNIFLHYFIGVFSLTYVLLDGLFRAVTNCISKTHPKKTGEFDCAFVSFSPSHQSVLNKIQDYERSDGKTYINVSARPISHLLTKKCDQDCEYIDREVTFSIVGESFLASLRFLLDGRKEICIFSDKKILSLKSRFSIQTKLNLSIRFKVLCRNFYRDTSVLITYLGNDTCYRAYWIIKNINSGVSVNVQHGFIENYTQYYSISDYFFCWDGFSMQKVIRNSKTIYIQSGYPKTKLSLAIEVNSPSEILFISTKFKDESQFKLLFNILESLSSNGFKPKIKLHPLESKSHESRIPKEMLFLGTVTDIGRYTNVFVIDSTFALDLIFANKGIVPLSFSSKTSFSEYFGYNPIENFLALSIKCSVKEMDAYISKNKIHISLTPEFNYESLRRIKTDYFNLEKC